MKTTDFAVVAIALFSAAAGMAGARTPLHEDPTVLQGFYAIGFANEVRKNCPQISPRLVRAYSFMKSLEAYARKAGYSDDDIEALKDNKAAKSKLQAQIRADLAARGATPGNTAAFCKVGRDEIARDTQAGHLLKGN